MASLKYYIADFNGILTDLKEKLKSQLASPRDADVWIVWQDVLGSYSDLILAAKKNGLNKRVYVVQHGGSSTHDYGPPNNFPLNADKYLCWGKSDYDRMVKLGYGDRTEIIGCPLNTKIKPKVKHPEKIVLFSPVNTGKEEPENIAAYYELLKLKYSKAQIKVIESKDILKKHWGFDKRNVVKFNELAIDFDVVAKLLPWHDYHLYHGNTITGFQDDPKNNQKVFELLRNVDAVIGLDDGTTQVFAYGHDVPVITVDGFIYKQHDREGRNAQPMDPYRTKASTHVSLENLADAVQFALAHPEHLAKERAEVAESELGISYGNAVDNIIRIVKNDFKKA